MRERARALGVEIVCHRAEVEGDPSGQRELILSECSAAIAGLQRHPDILVDASGRRRLFSRLLAIPTESVGRSDDVSYFAHYHDFADDGHVDGQVVLSILESGWSWQIPLKQALSVGVVVNKQRAAAYGKTPEQRLEALIDQDPVLRLSGRHRKRVSRVRASGNYPLVSRRTYGPGWVLLGDAYGFVDPMLSPGVFMALESAALLDKHLFADAQQLQLAALPRYCAEVDAWHQAWSQAIDYFYNGRLLGLFEAGQNVVNNASRYSPTRLLEWHLRRVISGIVSGVATRSRYHQRVLDYSCRHLLSDDISVEAYRIRQ